MPTWVDPAVIRASVASGLPGIGVGGTGYDIADDLEYLYDRFSTVGIATASGIHDDFTQNTMEGTTGGASDVEPYIWETGGTVPTISANPDHYARFSQGGGANYSVLAASPYKMRFDLSVDHMIFAEFRHKSAQSDNTEIWLFGFQDESLAVGASTIITTQSNIIGFVQDATANKYDGVVAQAAAPLVVANSVGDASAWRILRIEITFIGATKKVEFFIDGASVGSTTDTTKIPIVRMRPVLGSKGGGGTRIQQIDSCDFDWGVRPLSP